MWDWHPQPGDKVVWKGSCKGHLPDGPGEAQWTEHGRPIDRFIGSYRNGKREGEGHYVWNETVRFDGRYAGGVPQGPGVHDRWRHFAATGSGCLAGADGRVAIGVPRASCGPVKAQPSTLRQVNGRRHANRASTAQDPDQARGHDRVGRITILVLSSRKNTTIGHEPPRARR